jgi:Tol biopolymer transport system component
MHRKVWLLHLILLAAVVSGCAVVQKAQDLLHPPTPTSSVTVNQGQVRDAITHLPVAGARLQAGTATALSDIEGAFSISSLSGEMLLVTAPGYEPTQVTPTPGAPMLVVNLVPGAPTTFEILYTYEQQHEFARQYDLMHPDVQALFTCEEYVRYMEQERPYDILDFSVGSEDMLTSGIVLGKVYEDVAQVPVQATIRVQGEVVRRAWWSFAVKVDGVWRWLRGPLLWPTETPQATAMPTATETMVPSPTSTLPAPQATYTPPPTSTFQPTLPASPTPYRPILPGGQAYVIEDELALRSGPGAEYGIFWRMPRGLVIIVVDWPRWVEGTPWYPVWVPGPNLEGWCSGVYLAPLLPTPTATAQPVTPSPTLEPTPPGPPMTQRIAFTSERDGNRDVYLIYPNGSGVHNLTQHPSKDGDPAWAPGHDRLAFVSDRNGNNDIFVIGADGSDLRQITSSDYDEIHPAWSPDGGLIAYVSNPDGDWEIFVMSATGTGAVQLTQNEAWDSFPSWSPDGRQLVFVSDRDANYELYLYDLETRSETRLTENSASDAFPAWAPSGEEIAFISARDGQLELYILDLMSVPYAVARLTYTVPVEAANRYPTWSSDGNWLAFTSWRDDNAEIYVVQRQGWGLWNLTSHPATDEDPAWAN